MKRYMIENVYSGLELGVFEAENEAGAIEALARDAGYESAEAMLRAVGDGDGLRATLVVSRETSS